MPEIAGSRTKTPAVVFSEAPEVAEVARDLIASHHRHLIGQRIEYVFRSVTGTKGGAEVAGTTRKISSLTSYLAGEEPETDCEGEATGMPAFFVITIAEPVWRAIGHDERSALVDHELSHCGMKDGAPVLLAHDLEEFVAVVARHGMWRAEIRRLVSAAGAQPLLLSGEPGDGGFPQDGRGDIESITFSAAGRSVTLTPEQFDRAASRMGKDAAAGVG